MRWTRDDEKNRANRRKHGLDFEMAQLVFDDPLAATRHDPYPHETRWQTMGLVGPVALIVVHSWPDTKLHRSQLIRTQL